MLDNKKGELASFLFTAMQKNHQSSSVIRREKVDVRFSIAVITCVSVILGSCGPLGTPIRPLGPAPEAKPAEKDSPQERLDRFNIFLNRA